MTPRDPVLSPDDRRLQSGSPVTPPAESTRQTPREPAARNASTRRRIVVLALAGLPALAGCAATSTATVTQPADTTTVKPHDMGGPSDTPAEAAQRLPSAHVHGVDIDPGDGDVYLATHDGLFRFPGPDLNRPPTRVGPTIDLMGFAIAGPRTFYASGHPGAGTDLPNPVGLIKSTDAGQSWDIRSRANESDFHALTGSKGAVIAFDGSWAASSDERTWRQVDAGFDPYALASSPHGRTIVATTEVGPQRSTDGGDTWTPLAGAPLLLVVNWATNATVVGLSPVGQVHVSTDSGRTWQQRGDLRQPVQAVGAIGEGADLRVVAVTAGAIVQARGQGQLDFGATAHKR